ncbi:hypothetical protein [Rummeliibacillus sp. TYF005]|uniref:hypothetical protein n=1 Tax=Rummeliibacillus sp. TYF005 TaxID=2058214 RepID=UPI0013DDEB91|nr:hypothetical protein [Rummeliibacillus sp. TYF005]
MTIQIIAILGYYIAKILNTSISGMMATVIGVLFALTLFVQKLNHLRKKYSINI